MVMSTIARATTIWPQSILVADIVAKNQVLPVPRARVASLSGVRTATAGYDSGERSWQAIEVSYRRQPGKHLLFASIAHVDPNVWSGRALQEVSSTWQMRSCINVSGLRLERVVLRAIMDISARAF